MRDGEALRPTYHFQLHSVRLQLGVLYFATIFVTNVVTVTMFVVRL